MAGLGFEPEVSRLKSDYKYNLRAVKGSDYSPAIALSEEKDKVI